MAMESGPGALLAGDVGHMYGVEVQCLRGRGSPRTVTMSMQKLRRVQVQRADRLVHELRLASATPLPLLRQVADALVEEMCAGLEREGGSEQLKMLPSYVENLPSGCEPLFSSFNFLFQFRFLPTLVNIVANAHLGWRGLLMTSLSFGIFNIWRIFAMAISVHAEA